MALNVPVLALLFSVIKSFKSLKNNNSITYFIIKSPPFGYHLECTVFCASAIRWRIVSPGSPFSAPRWLLFDFDDKKLARAFAHSAR